MIKIHDCSDNFTAPIHRDISFGSRQNDIMFDLKKHAESFSFQYVDDWKEADVIITNTTFPPKIIRDPILKVKRMDGVYWREDEVHRNHELNISAIAADSVIFISNYSKRAFHTLYPLIQLGKEVVVLNNVDDRVFKPLPLQHNNFPLVWACACSNWQRPEKRWSDIEMFAEIIKPDGGTLIVIGNIDQKVLPKNVKTCGYINNYYVLNSVLNTADAFVNLSFQDAGCKCVSQAVNVGLPVLYANSGGVPELVNGFGVGVYDKCALPTFLDYTPKLDAGDIKHGYRQFIQYYEQKSFIRPHRNYINDTIGKYFSFMVDFLYPCGNMSV